MKEHRCEGMPDGVSVERWDGVWSMQLEYPMEFYEESTITHCPWCEVNLEDSDG